MDKGIKNPKQRHKLIQYANGRSLEEINGTVKVPKNISFWKALFMYSGPGALLRLGIWIRVTGQHQSPVDKTFNTC